MNQKEKYFSEGQKTDVTMLVTKYTTMDSNDKGHGV